MAIARSLSQPDFYVKIEENSAIVGVPKTTDSQGNETPGKIRCIISITKFKSKAERDLADTPGAMIWKEERSIDVIVDESTLELPEGWTEPTDPLKTAIFWLKAILYPVLKTVPEFADYVDYL